MKFARYLLPTIFAILYLQSCEQLTPKKTFHGKLSTLDGETLKLGYGQPTFIAGDMQVDLKSSLENDTLYSLSLQQGKETPYKLPIAVKKPLVYGSFTLEPAEVMIQQRIEGNIQRQFVGNQHSSIDKKSCTYSGICKHQVEKEEEDCIRTGVDNTKVCTKSTKMVEEYSYYSSCPGWEIYESTYQDANYHLTLLFFDRPQDKTASAIFEGLTDRSREQTSNIKTRDCSN